MSFQCNICCHDTFDGWDLRGDGQRVLYCALCGMGHIENPPSETAHFYTDGYYGGGASSASGYVNYELTSAHTQLWVQLFLDSMLDGSGRVLDIGCADGTMLSRLAPPVARFGIEANPTAAAIAQSRGITIISDDIADPNLAAHFGSFNVVSAIATFEHVLDMRSAVQTAFALMTEDGLLVYEVPLMIRGGNNKDWLEGSYEHITYPTADGLTYLMNSLGVLWTGHRSDVNGFSSSYIVAASRSRKTFSKAKGLIDMMSGTADPSTLPSKESDLAVAYRLLHGLQATPETILALPGLLNNHSNKPLLTIIAQLWSAENIAAARANALASSLAVESVQLDEAVQWWRSQAETLEKALLAETTQREAAVLWWRDHAASLEAALRAEIATTQARAEWWQNHAASLETALAAEVAQRNASAQLLSDRVASLEATRALEAEQHSSAVRWWANQAGALEATLESELAQRDEAVQWWRGQAEALEATLIDEQSQRDAAIDWWRRQASSFEALLQSEVSTRDTAIQWWRARADLFARQLADMPIEQGPVSEHPDGERLRSYVSELTEARDWWRDQAAALEATMASEIAHRDDAIQWWRRQAESLQDALASEIASRERQARSS